MNKRILIIVGIVVVLLTAGTFGYVLVFGTPEPVQQIFTDLNTSEENQPNRPVTNTSPENEAGTGQQTDLDIASGLQQITTRPVAGQQFITNGDQTVIRYVERGTGHIYEIDLEGGQEERVSNTTIPRVSNALISPSGEYVVLQSITDGVLSSVFGTIDSSDSTITAVDLPRDISNLNFSKSNTLRFTLEEGTETVGYEYAPDTESTEALFSIPIRNTVMHWADTSSGDHYVSTAPDSRVEGYLYQINGNNLLPTDITGRGLVVARAGNTILYTIHEGGEFVSYYYNLSEESRNLLSIVALPEKCDLSSLLYCAGNVFLNLQNQSNLPEAWYMGRATLNDDLYEIIPVFNEDPFLGQGGPRQLLDLEEEAGRQIDVNNLDGSNNYVSFINRFDDTLWLYEK